jgi:hypothetical protein
MRLKSSLAERGFRDGFYAVFEKQGASFRDSMIRGAMPSVLAAAGTLADQGGNLVAQEDEEERRRQAMTDAYLAEMQHRQAMTRSEPHYMHKGAASPWGYVGAGAAGLGAGLGAGYLWGKKGLNREAQPQLAEDVAMDAIAKDDHPKPQDREFVDFGVPDFQSPGYITDAELAQMYSQAAQAPNVYEMPGYAYY